MSFIDNSSVLKSIREWCRRDRRMASVLAALATCCVIFGAGMATPVQAGAYDDFFKAVELDMAPTVQSLLARGMDPNTIDGRRGDPALIFAIRNGSPKALAVLLEAKQVNLEARAPNGDTALMVAAYKGNREAVAALLAKGAEPNRPGWTALHYAASVGNVEIVRMLLEKSAYIDAEAPNKTTPLMMAARGGHTDTMKLLVEEGADVSLRNSLGMTAADFARKFADVRHEKPQNPW